MKENRELFPRVMLIGYFGPGSLESSYKTAFEQVGCEVFCFDIVERDLHYARLGRVGQIFNKFVPVEAWVRKANRDMVLAAQNFHPDLIVTFGQNRVMGGALAQIGSMMETSLVYIWQDTMVNLSSTLIANLPIYDLVATYSKQSVQFMERLGAKRVVWLPLAGDPHMHRFEIDGSTVDDNADVSFIGQWRPEREAAIATILDKLPDTDMKIWGPDWGRRSKNHLIQQAWQGKSLYGQEYAKVIKLSKISLNIIDDTNFPAANMRFFEIPCAGGLQVCSPCPEMEEEFRNRETIFYHKKVEELPNIVGELLENESLRQQVRQAAHKRILDAHTYTHRVQRILESINER